MKAKEILQILEDNKDLTLYSNLEYDKFREIKEVKVVYMDTKDESLYLAPQEVEEYLEDMGYTSLEEASLELVVLLLNENP